MKETTIIPIFFATDDAYAPPLGVALESLLSNVKEGYELRIHILSTSLSAKNKLLLRKIVGERAKLSFVDMKRRIAAIAAQLVLRDYYSAATYLRLFISEMFPEYDKALYLDCDIAVNGDISRLYEVPLGKALVGAIPEDVMARIDTFGRYVEVCLDIPRAEYFNAGILVMNLKRFRSERILERFVDLLARRRFPVTQDQDYLNVLCHGSVAYVPYTYNTSPLATELCDPPAIVHYKLDRKPWHYEGIHFDECFWKYAARTPYHDMLLAMRDAHGEEAQRRDREGYLSLVRLAEDEILSEPARRADLCRRVGYTG